MVDILHIAFVWDIKVCEIYLIRQFGCLSWQLKVPIDLPRETGLLSSASDNFFSETALSFALQQEFL